MRPDAGMMAVSTTTCHVFGDLRDFDVVLFVLGRFATTDLEALDDKGRQSCIEAVQAGKIARCAHELFAER